MVNSGVMSTASCFSWLPFSKPSVHDITDKLRHEMKFGIISIRSYHFPGPSGSRLGLLIAYKVVHETLHVLMPHCLGCLITYRKCTWMNE